MILVLDVDGTLSDWTARGLSVGPEPDRITETEKHDQWCRDIQSPAVLANEAAVPCMVRLVQTLARDAKRIIYLTARHEEYEMITLNWLKGRGFPIGTLICRSAEDKRPSEEMKLSVIEMLQAQYPTDKFLTIDDDPTGACSPLYRMLGVVHLKPMWCVYDGESDERSSAYKGSVVNLVPTDTGKSDSVGLLASIKKLVGVSK